jgi:uncharacterized membrane protein YeaQ/YmgE (transglycosylase-associated protein family)
MMHLIWMIVIGFVVGLIARALMPGRGPSGFFMTAVLGIAGSIAATFLGEALHLYVAGQVAGFIASVIGAMLLLFVYHLATRGRAG